VEKYKANDVTGLFLHNNRQQGDGRDHSNDKIDEAMTIYNYHLKKGTEKDLNARLNELVPTTKASSVVMCEINVTLPTDPNTQKYAVPPEEERAFFRAVYDFFVEDFGFKNVINAVVHKDEINPHIHIDIMPVVKGANSRYKNIVEKWKTDHPDKEVESLSSNQVINRKYLFDMHKRLSKYVNDRLGHECYILNGSTVNGNKTVKEMKNEKLDEEIAKKQKEKENLENDIKRMVLLKKHMKMTDEEFQLMPLIQRLADIENRNRVLREIIERQQYTYTSKELEAIAKKRYVPAKSQAITIYDGSVNDAIIEDTAVIVTEIRPDRMGDDYTSPQKKLIDNDMDLRRAVRLANGTQNGVVRRKGRDEKKIYVVIKTNGEPDVCMRNLLLFEQQLREIYYEDGKKKDERKLYMQNIEDDEYNLALQILRKNNIPCEYYVSTEQENANEIQKENDR
ncbi:plasmid recombination protein, partial [bacterium]|nr:plasmid recombination protein [bacterium]